MPDAAQDKNLKIRGGGWGGGGGGGSWCGGGGGGGRDRYEAY